ncbi:MAG TPA: ATP-binding protein, partial [Methanobacterium sp.]|nr:ATP-binding protein [Methanobacterium sp.]
LSRLNEEFEQYTYITAHYLQEHLVTIITLTKQLKQEYEGKLDNNIDDFINSIADESVNLEQMVFNLIQYEDIPRSKKSFKQVDMEKSLNKALCSLKIDKNDIKITYNQLPKFIADFDQITKVFRNLITNAIDFKKDDEPLKIHISARKDNEQNEYVFSVSDNGTGMDSQCIKHIFTIYYHLYLQEQHSVTGTCLSPTKKVIEEHGGNMWAESEMGIGSTFYFTLPINQNFQ